MSEASDNSVQPFHHTVVSSSHKPNPMPEDNTLEVSSQRAMIEQVTTDQKVTQKLLEMLQKSLFGNGQPGVIQTMQESIKQAHINIGNVDKKIDKYVNRAIGAFLIIEFLMNNGTFSLKNILEKFIK